MDVDEASDHPPVRLVASTYSAQEHRIRDGAQTGGYLVVTFANILKYNTFPLADILSDVLEIGRRGMGCPVEIEFAVNLPGTGTEQRATFDLLQVRPMGINQNQVDVEIHPEDIEAAVCYSTMALGNGRTREIEDVVFVNPETFDPARTVDIATEIGKMNKQLAQQNRRYLLIGPGRWGSADRWLGIPVSWHDIYGVGAMIETATENFKADPSQGSHFFHNITSLGISYLTTSRNGDDFIDWKWLQALPAEKQTTYLRHVKLENPLTIKIDGKQSRAVILP
jgi:hypothetical protein